MAAVITNVLTQTGSCISGSATHFNVAITNSDATTAASVTGIQLVVNPGSEPCNVVQPQIPVGRSTQVAASSTLNFPADIVFLGPQVQLQTAAGPQTCTVTAIVTCDDGSVCRSPSISVAPNFFMSAPGADGQLRFTNHMGTNDTYMVPFLGPL